MLCSNDCALVFGKDVSQHELIVEQSQSKKLA